MATKLSDQGRKLIQSFEGLSLTAYPDAAGFSIGYGHYGAKKGDVISREEAERLFDQDVAKYELAVLMAAPNTTQAQFDALTSLAYNIGTVGMAKSTVVARHNLGDYQGAADAFRMWNKSQGKELPVLTARREKERAVYLNGHGSPYEPADGLRQNVSTASVASSPVAADPKKSGLGQLLIGLLVSGGMTFLVWTRTDLLQGRFTLRKNPRAVPSLDDVKARLGV